MKILIVEDQKDLADSIATFISQDGYVCNITNNFSEAEESINLNNYDCAIVDIMLPDGSGLDAIKLLKKIQPKCGVIVVSAKNSLDDKITGLNLGADDYITKPFHLSELNARIKSVIRRRNFDGNNLIIINELKIDVDKREVKVFQKTVELTRKEFDILLFFISNKKRVITKEAIIEHIWGDDSNTFSNLDFVYTHIKNLRKKLSEAGAKDYINSVYGVGYKFSVE
jgi:DNA-binding response OmpR family regulator